MHCSYFPFRSRRRRSKINRPNSRLLKASLQLETLEVRNLLASQNLLPGADVGPLSDTASDVVFFQTGILGTDDVDRAQAAAAAGLEAFDDVVMYNDHFAGSNTAENVTSYATNEEPSGPLLNFETGEETGITMTTSQVGANFGLWSFAPAEGTDAYDIFNGKIHFTLGRGAEIGLGAGDSYTHQFSGLDANSLYDYAGFHARGNSSQEDRWTLVTLEGADSFTAAHSNGIGVVTDGLDANQVAIWTGENNKDDQGFVARWSDIDAGDDGQFEIVQQRYAGPIPTSVDASGVAGGSFSYGLTAVRLIESFAGLAVLSSDPNSNEKFAVAPTGATIHFTSPVDATTIDAADLKIDGQSASSFEIVDATTIQWQFPSDLGVGQHMIELDAGVLQSDTGGTFIGYSAPFYVVSEATPVNLPALEIDATTAEIGLNVVSAGFDPPVVQIHWGDNDGGTNAGEWDHVLDLGVVDVGEHYGRISGLSPSSNYFYRATATNLGGTAWSATTSTFTSATPVLATVANGPATDVSAFTVTLAGEVLTDGNDPPEISLFFGSTDAGTDASAWDHSMDLGQQTSNFSTFVTGLFKETDYFYRVRATNLAGSQWAPTSATFTTTGLPALTISEVAPSNTGDLTTRYRFTTEDDFGPEISPDWIEIHNPSPGPLDLVGLHLTDTRNNPTKWQFPAGSIIPANGYLVVYATNLNLRDPALDSTGRLHTNFVLSGDGEYLALTGGAGDVIFEYAPEYPKTKSGFTYGLDTNGEAAFFDNPTPESDNDDSSIVAGFVADTQFSIDRGFFDESFIVDVTTNSLGATIVYTMDGSEPTLTNGVQVVAESASTMPIASIEVTTTTAIRARAYLDGWVPTNADTHSYLFLDDVIGQPDQPEGFPTRWTGAPSVDYGMDPEVVNDPSYRTDLLAGLREIRTLSISSDVEHLFGSSGLYSNTQSTQEVPISAELILPDGSTGFQVDAGLKLQGGASRNPNRSPKHSMSLRFRDEYGEGKLDYPVFGESQVDSFDSLQLRGMYNNSWIHWNPDQRDRGTLIRDQFVRDLMIDMGNPDAQRGTYMHVYLDGLYWGVYNVHERADDNHYAAFNGGDQLDALNGGTAIDGDLTSYNAMRDTVRQSDDWDAIQRVLDVDNYIDWTILQRYGSNNDLKSDGNWRAAGGGPNNEPWRFYLWDTERILEGVTEGGPGGTADPPGLLSSLSNIEEFRLRFADRIQKHFFNDGPLTPENATETWNDRVTELTNAIVGESARWGDYRRDVHVEGPASLFTRDDFWLPEIERLRNSYFPRRTNIVVDQYRSNGLYPSVDAPTLQIGGVPQHGGQITAGQPLGFSQEGGTVYFTLDGTDPRMVGGDAVGTQFTQPISLAESATVNARRRTDDGTWSALVTANYVVVPPTNAIVISEINFNPYDVTDAETAVIPNLSTSDFEFIEVLNTGSTPINLLDMQITDGVEFTFPEISLAAGERAVVVENIEAFAVRYGDEINVVGQWSGGLSNGGERIAMADGAGNTLFSFEFSDSDPWFKRADGAGGTLVLADEIDVEPDLLGKAYRWRASTRFGGSPGAPSTEPIDVVINEVLANTNDQGNGDSIELYNPGSTGVDIGGWYLSDAAGDLLKYSIPVGTTIPAGGYVVFDESDFNPTPDAPESDNFALSGDGDDVWLVVFDEASNVLSFVDDVHFGATAVGNSVGRYGGRTTTPLLRTSLGCQNSYPRAPQLLISEVQYNPGEPSPAALNQYADLVEDDLEYIELHNPNGVDAESLEGWSVGGGIDYDFAQSTSLGAGETVLLISFNPDKHENADRVAAFRVHHGIDASVQIWGGYSGQLSDSGEVVRLRDANGIVDEVYYDDRAPWPEAADGGGQALTRVQSTAWGSAAASWAAVATPGSQSFSAQDGDLDANGQIDATDIDMLMVALANEGTSRAYDVNNDDVVDILDQATLLEFANSLAGDANLDGKVDALDLNRVGLNWLSSACASWSNGDFNGDGIVDASDLNVVGLSWLKSAAGNAKSPLELGTAALPTTDQTADLELIATRENRGAVVADDLSDVDRAGRARRADRSDPSPQNGTDSNELHAARATIENGHHLQRRTNRATSRRIRRHSPPTVDGAADFNIPIDHDDLER